MGVHAEVGPTASSEQLPFGAAVSQTEADSILLVLQGFRVTSAATRSVANLLLMMSKGLGAR